MWLSIDRVEVQFVRICIDGWFVEGGDGRSDV